MNARRSPLVTDFSVGFVLFVATLIFIVALFFVGGPTDFFGKSSEFRIAVPSASGLQLGSMVKLNGVSVGSVVGIELVSPEEAAESGSWNAVRIVLAINKRYADRIRRNSIAWLQTEGLLGDTSVYIGLGTTAEPVLPAGSYIPYKSRSLLAGIAGDQMTQNAADLLETIVGMLDDLNRGQGTLGQLLTNEDLYDNINKFTAALATASEQLDGITKEVEALLAEIRSNNGTFGRLISDPSLYDDAAGVVGRINRVLARAEDSRSVLARLATDEKLGARLASAVDLLEKSASSVAAILDRVEGGEGTLGALVRDPSIAAGLRDVLLGVREHGLVLNAVRNAERSGREAYLRGLVFSEDEELERLKSRAVSLLQRGAAAEGTPVPASGREAGEPEPEAPPPEED